MWQNRDELNYGQSGERCPSSWGLLGLAIAGYMEKRLSYTLLKLCDNPGYHFEQPFDSHRLQAFIIASGAVTQIFASATLNYEVAVFECTLVHPGLCAW